MTSSRKPFRLPRDPKLASEVRAAFKELPAEAVDEVFNLLEQLSRLGADKDDQIAIFNGRYEVLSREVPGGVFVLWVRDMHEEEWTLTGVSLKAPQAQTAVERCASALGVVIESLYIRK